MSSFDESQRRVWRANWLSSIQEFADFETQRSSWMNPANSNPHYSFVELVSCYFDGLRLSEGGYEWARQEALISLAEANAAAYFHQLVSIYQSPSGDYDHAAILRDKKWAEVVQAAASAQAALRDIIADDDERLALLDPGPFAAEASRAP